MSTSSLHVVIIGGGLGGLCLAQGLRRVGIDVALYERDASPYTRKQGYRLHIDRRGIDALHSCLPPHLFDLCMATASRPGSQVTIVTKQLKPIKVIGFSREDSPTIVPVSTSVDRLTLREILLIGLDDIVHFGKEFLRYEYLSDGRVRAFFSDGTEACGDVLIAADGVNSRVRQQFLPHASIEETDVRCIYGKTLLTEATHSLIPDFLYRGFAQVVGFRFSLALGVVDFQQLPAEAARKFVPDACFHTTGSYLMWSLNAKRRHMGMSDDKLFGLDGAQLLQFALLKTKRWHPALRALLAAGEPEETFPIAVRTAVPCQPWKSTSITLLGDAIHAMSPAGGSGANMALRDAHTLCQALKAAAYGERPLISAIHDYEAVMLEEGFEAVRFSARGGVLRR
ncbi:monooxygenase [Ktedonobacter sp. SOSP1-85]|uniref:FAD-dependent oxidoreductase n=1 Tax=Ktedonobacter sp. SOSP1-85 TaxID=2778367 RepID=UPI001915DCE6|nr:FAD-dependent monooxygenase [Ktedonobacter sp. SOSP1-85]GHO78004.1 monooxygenase [Ktedonobacter sp. SOSP1-85]